MTITVTPYPMPQAAQLPQNTVAWRPHRDRAALLIHDMQRYFLRALPASTQPGKTLRANVGALMRACRDLDIPVVYTAQPGDMSTEQRGLLHDFWGPGMSGTARDRDIIDELTPDAASMVFTKWRYSAFHRNDLLAQLRARGRDQLIICGVYAHVGCLATAIDAFSNDMETFIVGDAVADFSADHHQMALDYAAARCAAVLSAEDVIASLND